MTAGLKLQNSSQTRRNGVPPLASISESAKINNVKKLAILGSTGSIGNSTLSICESFPDRYQVISLAAGSNIDAAYAQCLRWRPKAISLATEELAADLKSRLKAVSLTNIEVLHGTAGSIYAATLPEVDFVVSAIVGVAGLEATYAAVCAGKTIGLANKECLVAAGELIIAAAKERNVALLPIDSEHNAVHQRVRNEGKVPPLQRRLEKTTRRTQTAALLLIHVEIAAAFIVTAVEIIRKRNSCM